MSTTGWIVLALVVVVVLVVLALLWVRRSRGREELRQRFGPEYQRAVESTGSRSAADQELRRRQERHDALSIHPLAPALREGYAQTWQSLQAQFVDDPVVALGGAQTLVQRVMADRGYPIGDFQQQAADLSVEHADVLDHYRAARAVDVSPTTTTEQLREAMVHYRALFSSLLAADPGDGPSAAERSAGPSAAERSAGPGPADPTAADPTRRNR